MELLITLIALWLFWRIGVNYGRYWVHRQEVEECKRIEEEVRNRGH